MNETEGKANGMSDKQHRYENTRPYQSKKENINIELPKKLNLQKVQSEYRPNTANKTG